MLLDRILAEKRAAVAARKRARPLATLARDVVATGRSLARALAGDHLGLLLECKRASPSAGLLRPTYDPAAIARSYADVASAISVLTDEPFFDGSLEHLRAVREAVSLPVLCKDFVVDPYQVYEARAYGADAVLLIVAALDDATLAAGLAAAHRLGMDALVEVHDEGELDRALAAGARVVGINNRNLDTLEVDLGTTERLAPRIPPGVVVVAESGVRGHGDLRRLRPLVDGLLVGTLVVREAATARAARRLAHGRVKVCGLTRPEDAEAAWRLGGTFGGLVLAGESLRHVSRDRARAVRDAAPELSWVGVFVNEEAEQVARVAGELDLDAVQLHGEETPSYARQLRALLSSGCAIWRGHRVRGPIPFVAETGADRLLLDAHVPGRHGGTGRTFDWTRLDGRDDVREMVLSGGLRPETAADADALGAWALDVSTGVETAPGRKSRAALARFFAALRGKRGRATASSQNAGAPSRVSSAPRGNGGTGKLSHENEESLPRLFSAPRGNDGGAVPSDGGAS